MKRTVVILVLALVGGMAMGMIGNQGLSAQAAAAGSRSPLAGHATNLGRAPAHFPLHILVGLDLHNKAALEAFIADVSDPASPHFQHFLSQDEFNALYGPTPEEEQRVVAWLTASGFQVTERFTNRLLVGAAGNNAAAERAFGVSVHTVLFQGEAKYAALQEPSFPTAMAGFITGVMGLDNLMEMRPRLHTKPTVAPNAKLGTNCCHFSPL